MAISAGRALLGITMYLTYPMESLVARHVIVELLYQGNMENTTINSSTGEVIPERKYCGLIGRRQFVTIVLFMCTLIPALIVDDLGPVLSITGSLGASCIAYIAPGMVYIGVNGGHFIQWVEGKASEDIDVTDVAIKDTELPIVGDATARISSTSSLSYHASSPTSVNEYRQGRARRPFWWCFVGMPLWMAIAKRGERGTREYMAHFDRENMTNTHANNDDTNSSINIVQPKYRDYYISIFMIQFGVLAVVCGLVSNIYVEINGIFFTPT